MTIPNGHEHDKAQPLRELEWLAYYFREHGRDDIAKEIFEQLQAMRHHAQDSLESQGGSNVLEFPSLEQKEA
jgi:hypothetical protein